MPSTEIYTLSLHDALPISNLLANVRTHTPEGTTATTSLRTEDGWAVLEVADDGPGIPGELVGEVFERFARGDSSRSRASGSTRSEEHTSELQSLAYLVCRLPRSTLFPYTTLFRSPTCWPTSGRTRRRGRRRPPACVPRTAGPCSRWPTTAPASPASWSVRCSSASPGGIRRGRGRAAAPDRKSTRLNSSH